MKPDTHHYTVVPGRGLLTYQSILARLDHLRSLGYQFDQLAQSSLDHHLLQKNIESFIGSVEVPVGVVGPLTVTVQNGQPEYVFTAGGTLEGALIASMNRGAKAISLSGGCQTVFYHQRMVRVPMFYLETENDAELLCTWLKNHFTRVKNYVERFSNHATLLELIPYTDGPHVHAEFIYTTGDASGQNMTTTCTWHGILWIREAFQKETSCSISDLIIESNGSSDKKVSAYLSEKGRGCKVAAEIVLSEDVIRKVLRTSSEALLKCVEPSRKLAGENGMLLYNINVANAIAAIFVATGQDLASIHESSLGELTLTPVENGVRFRLMLPSVVVGTVGGGTHLADRQEALDLMGCKGSGKVERFAQLIAAFALALEISTYAAIVSGEFATAHEKLGRNKPVEWLTKSDLNTAFFRTFIPGELTDVQIRELETEKGILTLLAKRVNKKFSGLLSVEMELDGEKVAAIMKNKPTDWEIVKGLHLISSSIDTELAHLLVKYKERLEYNRCHLKELAVYNWMKGRNLPVPVIYGTQKIPKKECFLIVMEDLKASGKQVLDSENKPHLWSPEVVYQLIDSLVAIQTESLRHPELKDQLNEFDPLQSLELYDRLLWIVLKEFPELVGSELTELFQEWKELHPTESALKTLVHNDFNPRNIAFLPDGETTHFKCYDWELSLWHYPLRDVAEFLCFVADAHSDEDLLGFIAYYRTTFETQSGKQWIDFTNEIRYCLLEFLFTRATFYVSAQVVLDIKFANRILKNAMALHRLLKAQQ